MKKSFTLLSTLIFCVSVVFAQDYSFKVLASKGVAQVDNGAGWKLLKSGSKLNKKNKVKVAQGSYVGLMHTSGKTIELKTPGTYDVANLSGKLNNSKSSFTSKYASFVLNQPSSDEAKQKYNVTGSVSRGTEKVEILFPKAVDMHPSIPLTVAWEGNEDEKYKFELLTLFEERIITLETENNWIDLDLSKVELKQEAYVIRVSSLTDPNDPEKICDRGVKIIKKELQEEVLNNYNKMKSELDETSPMDQLSIASYYEAQGLPLYVLSSLSKANVLAPDVDDFKILRKHYYLSKSGD